MSLLETLSGLRIGSPVTIVLATLSLLAFAFHTVAESAEDLWQKAAAIVQAWLEA